MDSNCTALLRIAAVGFFALAGWIWAIVWKINKDKDSASKEHEEVKLALKDKVDFQWLEANFKAEVKSDIDNLERKIDSKNIELIILIKEVRDALIGTVTQKGIITRIHEHSERIGKIEGFCKKQHPNQR